MIFLMEYVLLGVLQGIFEWLPVSSEGVVALSGGALTGLNPVDAALFLHLGTLLSVLVYFRKDWAGLRKDRELLRFLAMTTVVSLAVGFPVYVLVRGIAAGTALLAVMGIGLLGTSIFHRSERSPGLSKGRLALVAGMLQGLAVIPGLSRSGSTIFGLSLGKMGPEEILKVSYMMSAPVVLVSSAYLLLGNPLLLEEWPALAAGFLVGLVSLKALMDLGRRINFFWFTLAFAVLCFFGAGLGFLLI